MLAPLLLAAVAIAAARGAGATAPDGPPDRDALAKIHAAFMVNFVRYAKWTDAKLGAADAPIRLVVLEPDPFGTHLHDAMDGRAFGGRRVEIAHLRWPEDPDAAPPDPSLLADAEIVFVPRALDDRVERILAAIDARHVVTVGDAPEFAARGGSIGLVLRDGKVAFEMNESLARTAETRFSAKLLDLARLVPSRAKGAGG